MDRFNTLLEAGELAAARCTGWQFANSAEQYDKEGLLGIAEVHDEENPADEGSFYVVSPEGAIGLCEDGVYIDWLFLPHGFGIGNLPSSMPAAAQKRFCSKCGTPTVIGAQFCGQCGNRL